MMTATEDSPITGSDYNLTYRLSDNNDILSSPTSKMGGGRRRKQGLFDTFYNLIQSAKEAHSIELLMFFHMIGFTCTTVIVQNLYIDRICRLEHGFNASMCKNLTFYPDEEKAVEEVAAYYTMYRSIIEALVPVLFALFLGPFVDRNGSKLPILFCLCGYIVASLMYCFVSIFPSIPVTYLLICSVPISLTGGLVAFLMSAFTLISNKSTVANRSFRIAVLEGCWFLGTLGFLVASKIYKDYGFVPVFLISALCFSIALVYGIYFIEEHPGKSIQSLRFQNVVREVFDIRSVKDTLATVVRKREGPLRRWVIILMITIFFRMLALFGTLQVVYLYTRNKFQWDTAAFSKFSTIDTAICLSGGLIMLLVMKILKISDAVIGIWSAVGFVLSNLCFSIAEVGSVMYFGAVLQMFSGLITIIMRSFISKCVGKNELAKAFSFVSIGEACMPIIASLLFNPLYSSTVNSFPGAVFVLSAFLHGLILLSFIYFYFATRDFPFTLLIEDQ